MILTDAQKAIPALTSGITAGKKYKLRDGHVITLRKLALSGTELLHATDLNVSHFLYLPNEGFVVNENEINEKDIIAPVENH